MNKESVLIPLVSYATYAEAIGLRTYLHSCGIESHLRDENLSRMDPLLFNAIQGCKVEVSEEDYEEAKEALEAFNQGKIEILEEPCNEPIIKDSHKPFPKFLCVLLIGFSLFCFWRGSIDKISGSNSLRTFNQSTINTSENTEFDKNMWKITGVVFLLIGFFGISKKQKIL